ncbi:FG-GAP repeat domain-containing protein [Streptomyces sp. NPDC086023]|uniref:FG-GAP repeat domain-containing protein n=1 Tax=Streptomyces sp. NPDC086023 TaxID=3365746 RepID=UPI0037D8DE37
MSQQHSRRVRHVAGCTALALAAGLLTVAAGQAAAAEQPAAYALIKAKPRFDVDGDGRTDQITRSYDGKTRIRLSATGTTAAYTIAHGGDADRRAKDVIPAGDLSGTAAPELVVVWSDGELYTYSAEGTTGSLTGNWQGSGYQTYNKVLSPGDVTKDGRPDLLGRTPAGDLFFYRGTGETRAFAPRVRIGGGWNAYDQLVGTGDLDGDGVGDLLARTPSGDLFYYQGSGLAAAPFKARVKVGTGWGAYNQIIAADDLNGDGRADVLARTLAGSYYQFLSQGRGHFAGRTFVRGGGQYHRLIAGGGGVPDYGKHEVITTDRAGTAYRRYTLANGRLAAARQYGETGAYGNGGLRGYLISALDEKDTAHFGRVYSSSLWVEGIGDVSTGSAWGGYRRVAGAGDVTGDGKGDVVAQDMYGGLYLYPGLKGYLYPKLGTRLKIGSGWSGVHELVGAGDVSGDGRPDLLACDTTGRLYLHPGTGSATAPFGTRVLIGSGWNVYSSLAAPGDMTGDGRADLLAVDTAGDVYRYTATGKTGTATFSSRVKIASGWTPESDVR